MWEWINFGKLSEIEVIVKYADTIDMIWHIGIIKSQSRG